MTDTPMTVGEVINERYLVISVDPLKRINLRLKEGEADSLEAARSMADIILKNKPNVSMIEIIDYNSGHIGERHIVPRP